MALQYCVAVGAELGWLPGQPNDAQKHVGLTCTVRVNDPPEWRREPRAGPMRQRALLLACVLAFAAVTGSESHVRVQHDNMHGTAVRGLQQAAGTASTSTSNRGAMSTLEWPVPPGYT